MKRLFLLPFAVFIMMVVCFGCMMPVVIPPNPANPIKTIAVLPLENDTNDLDGPVMVREKMAEAVAARHYSVMPIEDVDRILRDRLGVTLGGQLASVPVSALEKELKVDGLVYGTLMDFSEKTIGVYNVRKVRARFSLVETATGKTVWKNGIGVKSETRTSDNAGLVANLVEDISDSRDKDVPWVTINSQTSDLDYKQQFALNLAVKLLSKATGTHLAYETNEMIKRVMETFPAGPGGGAVFAAIDSSLPAAVPPVTAVFPPVLPSIGHMDLGKGNFTAIMSVTWKGVKKGESMSWNMPVAKAGKRLRIEMDYRKALKGDVPAGVMEPVVMIYRGDKKVSYAVYPDRKQYLVLPNSEKNPFCRPKMKLVKVGSEVVDGHPSNKYKATIYPEDGSVITAYIWNARDLGNMTIKSVVKNREGTSIMLLKNIRRVTPPASRFTIPAGYSKIEAPDVMMLNRPGKSPKHYRGRKEKK